MALNKLLIPGFPCLLLCDFESKRRGAGFAEVFAEKIESAVAMGMKQGATNSDSPRSVMRTNRSVMIPSVARPSASGFGDADHAAGTQQSSGRSATSICWFVSNRGIVYLT